jgi:hypothetical protein
MGSEDCWFWARLWRWRRFEKPCNGAETKPKTEKTAAVKPISSHRYRFYGNALTAESAESAEIFIQGSKLLSFRAADATILRQPPSPKSDSTCPVLFIGGNYYSTGKKRLESKSDSLHFIKIHNHLRD